MFFFFFVTVYIYFFNPDILMAIVPNTEKLFFFSQKLFVVVTWCNCKSISKINSSRKWNVFFEKKYSFTISFANKIFRAIYIFFFYFVLNLCLRAFLVWIILIWKVDCSQTLRLNEENFIFFLFFPLMCWSFIYNTRLKVFVLKMCNMQGEKVFILKSHATYFYTIHMSYLQILYLKWYSCSFNITLTFIILHFSLRLFRENITEILSNSFLCPLSFKTYS